MKKLITIITPCYNEELNVADCYESVKTLFNKELVQYDYEHIFCDNDSKDNTLRILKGLASADRNVKVIVNSRNYGPQRSTYNALLRARGDAVLVMLAADLQDPPEIIIQFAKKWEEGFEVIYGVRANREEHFIMKSIRRIYYRTLSRTSNIDIPIDAGEFQLVDRVVVDALRKYEDYYPYIRGMIADCGFRSIGIPYTWVTRKRGMSKNRLYHLVDQALNGLISYTNFPMRLCILVGSVISIASIIYSVVLLIINIIYFRDISAPGIPTLIVSIFFFSGVQLLFLGIIGEYISAIHQQVRKKPLVIERKTINFD